MSSLSMPGFRIPGPHAEALVELLAMPNEVGVRVASEIDKSEGDPGRIAKALDSVSGGGLNAMRAILALLFTARRSGTDPSVIVDRWIRDAPEDAEVSGEALRVLLANRELRRYSKALDLRNEYERIYVDSRVLTDIRPIFDDGDDVDSLRLVVINQTLKLSYQDSNGEERDIFVALDSDDLNRIRKQIDRAVAKAEVARLALTENGVTVLEPLGEAE